MRLGLILGLAALSLSAPVFGQYKNAAPRANESDDGRGDVGWVEASDPEVNAAIAKARETAPDFAAALADPDTFNVTFKFPLGGYEHIWVKGVRLDGAFLTGVLDNVPIQKGWAKGDTVRVPIGEISDYFFCDGDGNPHGHFTTIVFIDREQGKGFTAGVLPRLCEERVEFNTNG